MRTGHPRVSAGRRACALAGSASIFVGLLLLPLATGTAPAAHAATPRAAAGSPGSAAGSPGPAHSRSPAAGPTAPSGGVVVRGPRMYDPTTNKLFRYHSYVTVSQVNDLANQSVLVTWQGFTPSTNLPYNDESTLYPVEILQCRGTAPASVNDCLGANSAGAPGVGPNGPENTVVTTTSPGGSGEADIELLTSDQNSWLGCAVGHPCSLVVVPAQGGIFTSDGHGNCTNHTQDFQTSTGQIDFGFQYEYYPAICAWDNRIVVPVHFDPVLTGCPIRAPDFTVIGSPMTATAMNSWQTALCTAASPLSIQYDSAQNEPLAREDFEDGLDDVALTTYPGSGTSKYPYTYAPVAVTAESVAFWIDSPSTGLPVNHIRLDARLVLKLITESYDFSDAACSDGVYAPGVCDNAVDYDPASIIVDPEFTHLNPGVKPADTSWVVPTVLSGLSDMTWQLTSWIAANQAAKQFAEGMFADGEHINSNYVDLQLPTQALAPMDPNLLYSHLYSPVFPLSSVVSYQLANNFPGTAASVDLYGNYDALPPEIPGTRDLFAILDQGDASAFLFPAASLQNAAGNYVAPTDAGMLAAVEHDMVTDPHNHITETVNLTNASKSAWDAYPLTMVVYAMVPTGGISATKAAKIAQWLDFVANQGQQPGLLPGNLPPGYLPLTSAMRAETLKAATEVLNQTGNPKKSKPASNPTPTHSKTASASPTTSPTPSSGSTVHLGYVANPTTAGATRYAVPVLLIVGGLLAVGGSMSLVIGEGGIAALGRLRKIRLQRRVAALGRMRRIGLPRRNPR
jgi:hypothetical protein